MTSPRQARAGASGHSPRLGARDPRVRTNAAGLVGDQDLGPELTRDKDGRTRISAVNAMRPLSAGASLEELIAAHNMLLAKLQGR